MIINIIILIKLVITLPIKIQYYGYMDFGIVEKLAKCIVRPPRVNYTDNDLGPYKFQFKNKFYERIDFQVFNNQGQQVKCSLYKEKYYKKTKPTLIILHANSSSRLSAKNYLTTCLSNYNVACLDFAGSGQSQGEYVSLGYYQKEDVYALIRKLRAKFGLTDFILWGRSMGAVTALLYAAKYKGIKGIIVDNAFSDFQKVAKQLSDSYLPILPQFLLQSVFDMIQDYIQQNISNKQKNHFNFKKLKPIQIMHQITIPTYFICSKEDKLVNAKHTFQLYEKAKCPKKLQTTEGDHNAHRSDSFKIKVLDWINTVCLQKEILQVGNSQNLFENSQKKIRSISHKDSDEIDTQLTSPLSPKVRMSYGNKLQKQWKQLVLSQNIINSQQDIPFNTVKRRRIFKNPQI